MIYLISDLHLNHGNIIKYCNRPFSSVEEMNREIIDNWNLMVDNDDTIYHLGDFCHGDPNPFLNQLNGNIEFIKGNHDHKLGTIQESLALNYLGEEFLLTHYPPITPGNIWTIHGHVHNNDLDNYPIVGHSMKSMNVSCELTNYFPISLDRLLKLRQYTETKALPLEDNYVRDKNPMWYENYLGKYGRNNQYLY